MRSFHLILRVASLALVALLCRWLAGHLGAWIALGIWALVVGVVCPLTAFALARFGSERVTIVNRIAIYVLPWGFRIGRGKLPAIAAISAASWIGIGALAVFVTWNSSPATPNAPAAAVPGFVQPLLFVAWLINVAVLLRFAQVWLTGRAPVQRSGIQFVLLLSLLVTVSVVLFATATNAAGVWLALAGGPPFFVGGGYLLFLVVVLLFGRKFRWN